jgi:putative Holliday junction resolvase
MGRLLGIDYGRKRIGLAVTDPLNIFASPLCTVNNQEFDSFVDNYQRSENIDAFVIGYPVQLNNQPSESVRYVDPFIKRLKKRYPEKPVHLVDERFTSEMALRTLIAGGMKKMERRNKEVVDMVSAAILLQSFLDRESNEKKRVK